MADCKRQVVSPTLSTFQQLEHYILSMVDCHQLAGLSVAIVSGELTARNAETDYLLVDVTEREMPRRRDYDGQKEEYSGKNKRHTVKNIAITTAEGYILYLGPSYQGSVHDKTMWDQAVVDHTPLNLLADLDFTGVQMGYPNAVLPYKKTQKWRTHQVAEKHQPRHQQDQGQSRGCIFWCEKTENHQKQNPT